MIAFVIGVFPPVIWQFIQAVFKKITFAGVFLPSVEAQIPLSERRMSPIPFSVG